MQKCSLCGGRVVNGRCEDCGLPIPPEHSYTLRGESAHYHRVNGEDVLHRVRPAGNRPKVEGYDDEERTAHVHESGTDRHNAPRPAVRTARVEHHIEAPSKRRRSANVAWLIIVVALFLILPMLQVLLQREIGSSVSEPVPEFTEEQAIEADSNAYDDLRPLVSAGGTDWDGDLPAGLYVVGQDLPAGTYTIKCAEDGTSMEMHLVNDACGVEILREADDADQRCGVYAQTRVLQADERDEQADTGGDRGLDSSRDSVEDHLAKTRDGQQDEDNAVNQDENQRVCVAQAEGEADSVDKKCVQTHAGGLRQREVREKTDQNRADDGGNRGCDVDRAVADSAEAGEHTGVDHQNVGHCHEGRYTGHDLGAHGRAVFLHFKEIAHVGKPSFLFSRAGKSF